MRGSCPSSQVILYGRPLTVTATWLISSLPPKYPVNPGQSAVHVRADFTDGGAQPQGFRLIIGGAPLPRGLAAASGFEPRDRAFEPLERLAQPAQPVSLDRSVRRRSVHPLIFLQ